MRLKIELKSLTSGVFGFNYNHHIQSFIYTALELADKSYADSIHKMKGPKFFTFSQLFFEGKLNIKKEGIDVYTGQPVKLFVSSPYENFIFKLSEGILRLNKVVKIGDAYFKVDNVNILKSSGVVDIFDTLSPITVSVKKDNRIYDLSPFNQEFYEQIKKNLLKKYKLFYGKEYKGDLLIDHTFITSVKPKRIKVKNTFHVGYHIKGLRIVAPQDMLSLAYDAGLGEKNSMGFGMIVERG